MADNLYPVVIPEYTESADIRKAFYRYHYGTDDAVTTPSEIQPNSMAKYLDDVIKALNSAQDRLGSISLLGSNTNLNDLTTAASVGIYQSIDNPSLSLNYPAAGIRGLLSVILAETTTGSIAPNTVYQTFQTQGTDANNDYYWRSGVFNQGTGSYIWTSWARASKVGHTHDNYVENNTLNNKIDSAIGASGTNTSNRAVATDAGGKLVPVLNVSAAQIGYLNDVTGPIGNLIGGRAPSSHNHDDLYYRQQKDALVTGAKHTARVFVQSTEPPANPADTSKKPEIGDLWFW